jgi:hypothetical protein
MWHSPALEPCRDHGRASVRFGGHKILDTQQIGDGVPTIASEMDEVRVKGLHRVEARDQKGNVSKAVLELRYRHIKVLPPIGKQSRYPALSLTVIHAHERAAPAGRKPIEWNLITDLAVSSRQDAIEKLDWYAMRWKMETLHKILKSGCKAEESKLRTADRLTNLIAVFCILSWRVFCMTMINRTTPGSQRRWRSRKLRSRCWTG